MPSKTIKTFRSFQNTGIKPVNLQSSQNSVTASRSTSRIYAIAVTGVSASTTSRPTAVQSSNFSTLEGTGPVSSQRVSYSTTYHPSNIKPFKVAALSDLKPTSSSTSILDGNGNDDELKKGYTRKIRYRIAQKKFYPPIAKRRGLEGQPIVAFILNKDGSLGHLILDKTSGYKMLDQAALSAVERGAPFPHIPEKLNLKSFKFKLPISFSLE